MMRKSFFSLVTLASSVLFLGVTQVVSADEVTEIVVATAGDIRPFSYEEGGQLTGYDIEVIKAASKHLEDYKVTFKTTAWESIFIGLDSGKFQIAANNLSYTKERAEKYLYSVPIAKNPLVLVAPKDSSIESLDDIGGKKTQDDTGTSTAQLVINWNKKHSDKSVIDYSGEDISKRLLDLSNKEFDYLIFDKISVDSIIKQQGYDFKVIEIDTDSNPNNYIIFSDDSQEIQKEFNTVIKNLYHDGTLEKLSQKYLGGNYLPSKSELK